MTHRSTPTGRRSWFLAGYLGLAGFIGLEMVTRKRGAAASLETSEEDSGTTNAIIAAYAIVGVASPALRYVPLPRLPRSAAAAGLVIQAMGLVIRGWSMLTLGNSYTRTLRVDDEPRVVDTGPYRLVRHPGYLGSLLIWNGFALTSRSVAVVTTSAVLLGDAYRRRIIAEEELLGRELPGYAAYRKRTFKLVPFVW
jgi:protein-S-isoprenylcysteine O-methyltransferase Ste14